MFASSVISQRSKRIYEGALQQWRETDEGSKVKQNKNNNDVSDRCRVIQNAFQINYSSSFWSRKYETSCYFLDNLENRDELSVSYRTANRWLLNYYDSDGEISSTYDDSDQDKTYSPPKSSSSSDNENTPHKRSCIKKTSTSPNANRNILTENLMDKQQGENNNKYCEDIDGKENTQKTSTRSNMEKQDRNDPQDWQERKKKQGFFENIDERKSSQKTLTSPNANKKNILVEKQDKNIIQEGRKTQKSCTEDKEEKHVEKVFKDQNLTMETEDINRKENTELDIVKKQDNNEQRKNKEGGEIKVQNKKKSLKRDKKNILEITRKKHEMLKKCNGKCRQQCSELTEEREIPPKCCVPGCTSNYASSQDGYVTVFRFPVDVDKRQLWLKNIPRKDWSPTKTSVVCINFFKENDVSRFEKYKNVSVLEL
ncbi:unnamed protein product [Psylliodes chrysocephalus]|uniref:THAP-type domain-containing protein n=1 Tax=Psylliodes chrysocephalus TaxID=3402493 RepID=A0A9P0DDF5_9CUCU|nr:unnamed protein product [Psylliodes chrysocephala]